jgi:hypothetical protein
MPVTKLIVQIRAKLLLASIVKGLRWQHAPSDALEPQKLFRALANPEICGARSLERLIRLLASAT